jgi:hypothetical protein
MKGFTGSMTQNRDKNMELENVGVETRISYEGRFAMRYGYAFRILGEFRGEFEAKKNLLSQSCGNVSFMGESPWLKHVENMIVIVQT